MTFTVDHVYNSSYSGGWDRRIVISDCLKQNYDTLSEKQTVTKKKKLGWGKIQVLEHFPSKQETLNSNTSTTKKKF
jgi:hypothetical protein